MKLELKSLPSLLIILSGIMFSLLLQTNIPSGVFFNGDAGLKMLLTDQLNSGNFQFNIEIQTEPWVKDLWKMGYYPFDVPFVYDLLGKKFIAFPVLFPLLSVPFYKIMGFRGLNVLPLLALWSIWFYYLYFLRQEKFSSKVINWSLVALIFSCPLTIYSAFFWEHTLAVLLAFQSVSFLTNRNTDHYWKFRSYFKGLLLGFSGWLRPECYSFAILVCTLTAFNLSKRIGHKLSFYLGVLSILSLNLISNQVIYGHPFGVHSFQVITNLNLSHRVGSWSDIFIRLSKDSFLFFPFLFLVMIIAIIPSWRKHFRPEITRKLFWVCVSFVCVTPIMLPNFGGYQWGPRYFLVLFPTALLIATYHLENTTVVNGKMGLRYYLVFSVFFICIFSSGYNNTVRGFQYVRTHYSDNSIIYNGVRTDHNNIVVAANPWIPMGLTNIFKDKTFFCARSPKQIANLSINLMSLGITRFLYVKSYYEPEPQEMNLSFRGENYTVAFSNARTFCSNNLYNATILYQKPNDTRLKNSTLDKATDYRENHEP